MLFHVYVGRHSYREEIDIIRVVYEYYLEDPDHITSPAVETNNDNNNNNNKEVALITAADAHAYMHASSKCRTLCVIHNTIIQPAKRRNGCSKKEKKGKKERRRSRKRENLRVFSPPHRALRNQLQSANQKMSPKELRSSRQAGRLEPGSKF